MDKRIIIGADHGGYELKKKLIRHLKSEGYDITDEGTHSIESCDYPDFAFSVSEKISNGTFLRGILICTTGIGVSICANKLKNIRAALCSYPEQAEYSRRHNNSNILALGSKYVTEEQACSICDVWLNTDFEKGRHEKRVKKISNYENKK